MSITVPAAGDPVTAAWGESVADQLNTLLAITATTNQTTSSTSWSDIDGLTFPVTSGKQYVVQVSGQYSTTAVGNGFVVGFNNPGGTCFSMLTAYGNGGPVTPLIERVSNSTDGGTGIATVDSTASRGWRIDVNYNCTSDGTFALRWKRPGGTASAVTMVQAGGIVTISA